MTAKKKESKFVGDDSDFDTSDVTDEERKAVEKELDEIDNNPDKLHEISPD